VKIEGVLPYAKPWIMIDEAIEVENGVRAVSVKNISSSDFFLIGHFPDGSIYPGMLLLEGMKQTTEFLRLRRKEAGKWTEREIGCRFLHPVEPGDRVKYVVHSLTEDPESITFRGDGWVGERRVIQATITYRKEDAGNDGGTFCRD
jgi:3-hydroxyacyl-[acyl-carrier-protein] dehydratase